MCPAEGGAGTAACFCLRVIAGKWRNGSGCGSCLLNGNVCALLQQTVCVRRSSPDHRQDKQAGDANQTSKEVQYDVWSAAGRTAGPLQELQGGVSQEVLEGELDFPSCQSACAWRENRLAVSDAGSNLVHSWQREKRETFAETFM